MTIKSKSSYSEEATTKALSKHGAFFAFSEEQLREGMKANGIEDKSDLRSTGAGMLCHKDNCEQLYKDLTKAWEDAVRQDKKENTTQAIIIRELGNYECQIVGSDENARDALSDYGFTDSDFKSAWTVFWNICIENDYF